ncbi:MAG TPA: hypothetical protein V6C58_11625 [Allocoleopsis sp.]
MDMLKISWQVSHGIYPENTYTDFFRRDAKFFPILIKLKSSFHKQRKIRGSSSHIIHKGCETISTANIVLYEF